MYPISSCLLVIFYMILVSVSETESSFADFLNIRYKPITRNIDTKNTIACPATKSLNLIVTAPALTLLFNTGSSVQTNNQFYPAIVASSGPLNNKYFYLSVNYYWASNATKTGVTGTTIDKKGFPYAVRVFYINEKYKTFEEALHHEDGFADFVFLIKICSTSNTLFGKISKKIQQIPKAGSFTLVPLSTHIEALDYILPLNAQYYTYKGEFLDTFTMKKYKSSTVLILKPNAKSCITQEQFNQTFNHLTDSRGKQLFNNLTHDSSELQSSLCQGIFQIPN